MRELDEVLNATLDEGDRALAHEQLGADALAVLSGRIKARRARRRVLQAAVTLPVAAAVVMGAVVLVDRLALPAPTPTVPPATSPEQSVSPTPEPTPDPTGSADLVPLPDEPGLPPRYAAPDGLLAAAEPGWVLAVYQPMVWDSGTTRISDAVLTLTSPDGLTYELVRLSSADGVGAVSYEVLRWGAGDVEALVARVSRPQDAEPTTTVVRLDLSTGDTADAGFDGEGLSDPKPAGDSLVWTDWAQSRLVIDGPDGRVSAVVPNLGGWHASPDGRYLLVGTLVLETATGSTVADLGSAEAAGSCSPLSWWTSDAVLLECADSDPFASTGPYLDLDPRLVVAPVAGGTSTVIHRLAVGDPTTFAWYPAYVSDGVVAVQGTTLRADTTLFGDLCPDAAYVVTADRIQPLSSTDSRSRVNVFHSQAAGGRLVVEASGGCSGDDVASTLDVVDPATGAASPLIPLPVGYVDDGGPGTWWPAAPGSWVLGR